MAVIKETSHLYSLRSRELRWGASLAEPSLYLLVVAQSFISLTFIVCHFFAEGSLLAGGNSAAVAVGQSKEAFAPGNGTDTFQTMDDYGEGGFGDDGFGDDAAMDADEPEVTHLLTAGLQRLCW